MAENTIQEFAEGDPITIDDENQVIRAIKGNLVPRNSQGVAENQAGSLGTAALRWDEAHIARLMLDGMLFDPTTISQTEAMVQLFNNGVVSGVAPTGRPEMCGWMNPAGTGGITLRASASNPLVVRVGGEEHMLESDLVGGTPLPTAVGLPTGAVWQFQDYQTAVQGGDSGFQSGEMPQGTDPLFALVTGDAFKYADSGIDVPSTIEQVVIFRAPGEGGTDGEYIVAERASAISSDASAQKGARALFNHSSTAYTVRRVSPDIISPAANERLAIVTPGYIFVDPTTSPWTIAIRSAVLGSVQQALPTGTAGQVVYRQSADKWYSFEGAQWVEKEWVFLGIAAIEDDNGTPSVQAVSGVRSERGLNKLHRVARGLHTSGGVWQSSRAAVYQAAISGNTVIYSAPVGAADTDIIEEKAPQAFASQQNRLLEPRYSVDVRQRQNGLTGAVDATLNGLFCVWADAETGAAFSDNMVPAIVIIEPGQAYLAHPHRNAVLVGTYSITGQTNIAIPTGNLELTNTPVNSPALWHKTITLESAATQGVVVEGGDDTANSPILGWHSSDAEANAITEYTDPGLLGPFRAFQVAGTTGTATISFTPPTLADIAAAVAP